MHRDVKPLNLYWNRAIQMMQLGDLGQTVYVRCPVRLVALVVEYGPAHLSRCLSTRLWGVRHRSANGGCTPCGTYFDDRAITWFHCKYGVEIDALHFGYSLEAARGMIGTWYSGCSDHSHASARVRRVWRHRL